MKLPKNLNPLHPPIGQFQTDTIGFGVIHENSGLLLPVGLGKTYCSINVCKWRIQNNNVKKILILCPTPILTKWQEEIEKFSGHNSIILHNQNRDKRLQLINRFTKDNTIYGLINYEGLSPYLKQLLKIKLDMIVADESSRYIKNLISGIRDFSGHFKTVKRTEATLLLGDKAKYRIILTGTLITAKPLDIWSQFRFLDKGEAFGDNYYAWRGYYFNKIDYGNFSKLEIKQEKIKQLNKKIFSKCIRFEKKDVMPDLPESMYQTINITMEDSLQRIYDKLQKKIISEIETAEGTAVINILHIFTKLIRLQQVTSGYIKDEDNIIKDLKQTPKLDAVMEEIYTVLDSNESVIIWCKFRYTISLISKKLTKNKVLHTVMTGSDNPKQKTQKWKGFQKSKTINVFIGQVVAGGIGIELFKIDSTEEYQHILFVENTFVLDHREQAIGRNEQRIGQNAKCRIVDFVVKRTIDEKILNTIKQDKKISDMIMKGGVRKWLS